jgi:hypothetical protein
MQESATLLSIAQYAKFAGLNPLHTQQVNLASIQRLVCGDRWFQYGWQNSDAVSREELAEAIARAERTIASFINTPVMPTWVAGDRQLTTRPNRPELVNWSSRDVRGYRNGIFLAYGRFIQPGVRAASLIAAGATITWDAPDTNGWSLRGTVTVTTSVDDCEVQAFYPGKAADPRWRIRPVTVTPGIAPGDVDITFRRELCVLEALQDTMTPALVEGSVDTNFISTLDVYRVYNDSSVQANLLWEPVGTPCCANEGCPACALGSQTACIVERDRSLGLVSYAPATWNAELLAFQSSLLIACRQPDMVEAYYQAGYQAPGVSLACPMDTMDDDMLRIVAILATAYLDRPSCGCREAFWSRWQTDLAFSHGAEELAAYQLTTSDLENPIGTRRGMIEAWRYVNRPGLKKGNVGVRVV